ncbi:MAG: erythromycin esterase family protein, partial [Bacteroidota bacterium]
FFLFLGLSLFACEADIPVPRLTENDQTQVLTKELTTYTTPLSDLSAFDYLADAQVTGLGEATHGTHEFFTFKHELFRYLVEEHGYRALVFEIDFAEALLFDDYVRRGKGTPEQLMQDHMYLWLWQTQEIRDLLLWMRDFNRGRAASDQVRFLGNDAQTTRYNARALHERILAQDPALAAEVWSLTKRYRQLDRTTYRQAGEELHQRIVRELRTVQALVAAENDVLLDQLSQNLLATEALLWAELQRPYVNRRDLRMAINTQWWAEHLGVKTVVWAHNLHVGDHPTLLNSGAMGSYLKDVYGVGYQSIGFSFSQGRFLARDGTGALSTHSINYPPAENTIHYHFDKVDTERFFLRLADLPQQSMTMRLLKRGPRWYTVGASFLNRPLLVALDFDGIVHFQGTAAAKRLSASRRE